MVIPLKPITLRDDRGAEVKSNHSEEVQIR